MSVVPNPDRMALTQAPIDDLLAWRWSPRSFDAEATVTDTQVLSLMEAARWAASGVNLQPCRFVVGKRGTPTFDAIASHLNSTNQVWAGNASLLILMIAVTADSAAEGARVNPWAEYDTGQPAANIVVQAHALGLHAHQMGGMAVDDMRKEFDLASSHKPLTAIAVGALAPADLLPDDLKAREIAERTRLPLGELILRND